jgi:membrane-bound metal-dependent hydrolase YbcI (DUF457 family)
VQGGVHLLSGLILASFTKRKEFKLGAVIGAIIPDFDIIITAFAYLAIGEAAADLHRSFSHSLFFFAIVTVVTVFLGFIPPIKKRTDYDFLGLGIGLGLGILMHCLLDMPYLYGIQFYWPFSSKMVGFPIVPFESLDTSIASISLKLKLLQTTDFYTDIFLFYIPILFLAFQMKKHEDLHLPFLIYIIVDFIVTTIFVGLAFRNSVSYEDHTIQLYYLGTFFLMISLIAPILFRNVIREFNFDLKKKLVVVPIMIIIVVLIALSQYLFYV